MFKLVCGRDNYLQYVYKHGGVAYYLDITSDSVTAYYSGGQIFSYEFKILGDTEARIFYSKERLLDYLGVKCEENI